MASQAVAGTLKQDVVALKRARILDTATRLMLENGYQGCSMDALAQALGVTKPFIYYQFQDKSEILARICSRGAELSVSALDQAEALAGSCTDRMRWFCRQLIDVVLDHGDYLAVYVRETANLKPADRKAIAALRAQIDRRVTRLIEDGVQAGEFQVEQPRIVASAVTVMLSNCFQWRRPTDLPPREEFARVMTEIAMRTLRPGAAG